MANIITYNGQSMPFVELFYEYAIAKEGYRNTVYRDVKGYPTVGIGHLLTDAEKAKWPVGTTISNAEVYSLFVSDYDKLQIDKYTSEIKSLYPGYNMMLAVAHFIWGHGYGQYNNSHLRGGLLNKTFTKDSIISYLNTNWDLKSPTNQRVNREDFTVGFSQTPWQASGWNGIEKSFSSKLPWLSDFIKNHKFTISIILIILILILLLKILR